MKKNPKKPVAKATKKPTDIPISKTVARPPIPAVHLPPPPDDIEPGSPEEAFHYSIVGGYVRASRHRRNADRIRLESGVPYKGKDARLAGSVIYDRDALLKASERAEAEEREAEKCLAAADRAKQELQHYLDRKANLKLADALLKHTAALTNAPAPTTAPDQPSAPTEESVVPPDVTPTRRVTNEDDRKKPACVERFVSREEIKFTNGDHYAVTSRGAWVDALDPLLHPNDPEGWVTLPVKWRRHFSGSGVKDCIVELRQKHIQAEARGRNGKHRFRLV
ncbi:MAG: hypothetical protein IJV65_08845 [Kiritimatiellae bacterium]|nr:hypothetical protein [Kiritimatiellia bacterium]